MSPIFQKPKLKKENIMVVMSNLAFNLLVGKRFFMRNAFKYILQVSLLVCHLETNQKKKKNAFLNIEKFSIMIKIPNIK